MTTRAYLVGSFALLAASTAIAQPAQVDSAQVNPAQVDRALADYVAAPDPSFAWKTRAEHRLLGGTLVELTVTSQTWRDVPWRHQVFVFKPAHVTHPEHALLVIGGGRWNDALAQPVDAGDTRLPPRVEAVALAAAQLGTPVAAVLQVPFQPIFGQRVEDDAIAYTFEQYMRTGDASWPLLLPMVKSVVRAMDAVQQYSKQAWRLDVESFTVTGASKRGWTTWLTAAVDDRVAALVPMVFDVLDMEPQLAHQQRIWGKPSPSMVDYTQRGLIQRLRTPPGRALQRIVDPFHYLDAIHQPKLIALSTNDSYWPVDALNFYWDSIEGLKYVMYMPNQGHGSDDLPRLLGGLVGVVEHARGQRALPEQTWTFENSGRDVVLKLHGQPMPDSATVWFATAPSADLRKAKWTSAPMEQTDDGYVFRWRPPVGRVGAIFGEGVYARGFLPLHLSTTVHVVK